MSFWVKRFQARHCDLRYHHLLRAGCVRGHLCQSSSFPVIFVELEYAEEACTALQTVCDLVVYDVRTCGQSHAYAFQGDLRLTTQAFCQPGLLSVL